MSVAAPEIVSAEPLGNWYRLAVMEVPDRSPGGIILPTVRRSAEAVVMLAGPGRMLDNGFRARMHVQPRDRVLLHEHDFHHWKDGEAFARDEDLIAYRWAPHFKYLCPLGQYVLIRPQIRPRWEETATGVVVSTQSLRGGEGRELERGEELHKDFYAYLQRLMLLNVPKWERLKLVRQRFDDLCPLDQEDLQEAYARRGETGYQYTKPISQAEAYRCGVCLGLGPAVHDLFVRAVGKMVHWCSAFQATEIWDGRETLLAIRTEYLDCYEDD